MTHVGQKLRLRSTRSLRRLPSFFGRLLHLCLILQQIQGSPAGPIQLANLALQVLLCLLQYLSLPGEFFEIVLRLFLGLGPVTDVSDDNYIHTSLVHTTAEGDTHLRRECLPIAAPSDIAFVLRVFHVEQRVQELLIAAIIRVGTLQQDEDGRADYLLAFPPE